MLDYYIKTERTGLFYLRFIYQDVINISKSGIERTTFVTMNKKRLLNLLTLKIHLAPHI